VFKVPRKLFRLRNNVFAHVTSDLACYEICSVEKQWVFESFVTLLSPGLEVNKERTGVKRQHNAIGADTGSNTPTHCSHSLAALICDLSAMIKEIEENISLGILGEKRVRKP
jgi:hypothetical protein